MLSCSIVSGSLVRFPGCHFSKIPPAERKPYHCGHFDYPTNLYQLQWLLARGNPTVVRFEYYSINLYLDSWPYFEWSFHIYLAAFTIVTI